jgi:hypothetical protein
VEAAAVGGEAVKEAVIVAEKEAGEVAGEGLQLVAGVELAGGRSGPGGRGGRGRVVVGLSVVNGILKHKAIFLSAPGAPPASACLDGCACSSGAALVRFFLYNFIHFVKLYGGWVFLKKKL